ARLGPAGRQGVRRLLVLGPAVHLPAVGRSPGSLPADQARFRPVDTADQGGVGRLAGMKTARLASIRTTYFSGGLPHVRARRSSSDAAPGPRYREGGGRSSAWLRPA